MRYYVVAYLKRADNTGRRPNVAPWKLVEESYPTTEDAEARVADLASDTTAANATVVTRHYA